MVKETNEEQEQSRKWILVRLITIFIFLLFLGFAFYEYEERNSLIAISYSILFVLPFSFGALVTFLHRPKKEENRVYYELIPIPVVLLILMVGGLRFEEGLFCMLILSPFWILSAFIGKKVVQRLQHALNKRKKIFSPSLVILPFLFVSIEGEGFSDASKFVVKRSIVIEAQAKNIWPHLLSMENIKKEEGGWNFTQDVLGIPRPTSAIVTGTGEGAIRNANWGENISFEEHIITWQKNQNLRWNFVFPNNSVQKYTDRHISPDGKYLKIAEGGYSLQLIDEYKTLVTLETIYIASTPVNKYSSLWGELILGDIQNNILEIVKTRSEKH